MKKLYIVCEANNCDNDILLSQVFSDKAQAQKHLSSLYDDVKDTVTSDIEDDRKDLDCYSILTSGSDYYYGVINEIEIPNEIIKALAREMAQNELRPKLDHQIGAAADIKGSNILKEYELTLFQGDEDEQIIRAMLTDEQAEMICKNISGVSTVEQNITLVGGSVLEVGCIDAIEILDGDSLMPVRQAALKDEER